MFKKSIVIKQFLLYMATISFCVILMGGMLSVIYTTHYMSETKQELIEQGEKIAGAINKAYNTGNINNLAYEMQVLEDYMGAGVLLVNKEGVIVLASPGMDSSLLGHVLAYDELVKGIQEGNVVSLETGSSSIFGTPMLIVGYPLSEGQLSGIFMCRSMPEIKVSLNEMYRAGVFCLLLAFLLTALVSLVTSRKMTEPLMDMNRAAKEIAGGNFEKRVEIKSDNEMGQLAESFNHMAESLENIEKSRRAFIANVSHELRSPLALITGYAEMVRDITWKDEEMRNENLNLIISESNRMSEMVNDILDYSQFSAGYSKLKKDWYDLRDIVNAELTRCRQAAAEHGITLTLQIADAQMPDALPQGTTVSDMPDTKSTGTPANNQAMYPLQFQVDALKMSQVMRNLLNNAINHTPENQEIFIRLIPNPAAGAEVPDSALDAASKIAGSCCLVEVANPGDPIPEEDRNIIWERYQRSQHQSGRRLGTGIGLSIVSTILKAHEMLYGVDCKDGYNIFWFVCR